MNENPYTASLETRIFSATPMELVKILYEAAIEAVQTARAHLAHGEIFERGRCVSKAVAILGELNGSLDFENGGEVSTRLAAMYDYLQRTLLDANFRQADDGLAAAEAVLKTLNEAWFAINPPQTSGPAAYAGSTEPCLVSYGLAGNTSPVSPCASTGANQWCA